MSPFLQVDIHHLPSGEVEAQIRKTKVPKPISVLYGPKSRVGPYKPHKYERFAYYPFDNVFVIGPSQGILDKLKQKLQEQYPSIAYVKINYHRSADGSPQKHE